MEASGAVPASEAIYRFGMVERFTGSLLLKIRRAARTAFPCAAIATPRRANKALHDGSRPGASAADIQHDIAECQYQAKAASASYHSTPAANDKTQGMGSAVGDGIIIAEKLIDLKNDCMLVKVYLASEQGSLFDQDLVCFYRIGSDQCGLTL